MKHFIFCIATLIVCGCSSPSNRKPDFKIGQITADSLSGTWVGEQWYDAIKAIKFIPKGETNGEYSLTMHDVSDGLEKVWMEGKFEISNNTQLIMTIDTVYKGFEDYKFFNEVNNDNGKVKMLLNGDVLDLDAYIFESKYHKK